MMFPGADATGKLINPSAPPGTPGAAPGTTNAIGTSPTANLGAPGTKAKSEAGPTGQLLGSSSLLGS